MVENRLEELLGVIAAELELPQESLHGRLRVEDLGLDSLAFVELIVTIEQQMDVRVDADLLPRELSPGTRLDELTAAILSAAAPVS